MEQYCIYILTYLTGGVEKPFYAGYTHNPKQRYENHYKEALRAINPTRNQQFIRKIVDLNQVFNLRVINVVNTIEEAYEYEEFIIAFAKHNKIPLTNQHKGGKRSTNINSNI